MGWFSRRPKGKPELLDMDKPIDVDIAKRVADLVNAGDIDGAQALVDRTDNPRGTAFLAFRWIKLEGE